MCQQRENDPFVSLSAVVLIIHPIESDPISINHNNALIRINPLLNQMRSSDETTLATLKTADSDGRYVQFNVTTTNRAFASLLVFKEQTKGQHVRHGTSSYDKQAHICVPALMAGDASRISLQ